MRNFFKRNKKMFNVVLVGAVSLTFFGYQFVAVAVPPMKNFGEATVKPEFMLNGRGKNIDSLAFWESSNIKRTLLFVTGKGNERVEVWKYPFNGNERKSIKIDGRPNGVAVNQKTDELFVADSDHRVVIVYSIPELDELRRIGDGAIEDGETNLDIYNQTKNGKDDSLVYVTENSSVKAFDASSGEEKYSFDPTPKNIETIMADSKNDAIYIPEENGGEAKKPGVYAYDPDGSKFKTMNYFGRKGIFESDEEGILLYKCLKDGKDTGRGFIVVTDQLQHLSEFEFFDRKKWTYLGKLKIEGVSNTDGIASIQKNILGSVNGLFAAVNDDESVAIVKWDTILAATGLKCE